MMPQTESATATPLSVAGAPAGARGARALLEAMRPRQWAKNAFVFAGVMFGGKLREPQALLQAGLAFAAFCLASSAVYLANDTADRDADAHHPQKRLRPIASGRLPVALAVPAAVLLAGGGLALSLYLHPGTGALVAVYLLLSVAYSAGLKRVFLLDTLMVSVGFVLRAAVGAAAVDTAISPWLLCCTFLLAFFLVLGKRRQELRLLGADAERHRGSLSRYTAPLVDGWLSSLSGAAIVAYALYTQSARTVENFKTTDLVYTVPFVVYALFRYQALVVTEELGGDPTTAVLRDRGIMAAVLGWAAAVALIIYR